MLQSGTTRDYKLLVAVKIVYFKKKLFVQYHDMQQLWFNFSVVLCLVLVQVCSRFSS